MTDFTRRDAIKTIGATAAAMGLGVGGAFGQSLTSGGTAPSRPGDQNTGARRRIARIAHLTDIHVQPELRAGAGLIACLHHVESLKDKPEWILSGGDHVMDSFEADDARTAVQWNLWKSILKTECGTPIRSCIGNHDVWGWNKKLSKTTGDEPNYGKRRATEMLSLAERYYSFDIIGGVGGWRVIALDGVQPDGAEGYRAFLDPPQLDWLKRELGAIDKRTNVLVLSHVPIIAASAVLWAPRSEKGGVNIRAGRVHEDAPAIKDVFAQHPNVRLCLSGHLHHLDRVDYNGVTYLCNGAVSGNWWKGRNKDTDEGYAVIDLFDDGSFEHEYVRYGWKAGA